MKPFTRTDIATRQVIRVETVYADDLVDALRRFEAGEGRLVREEIGPAIHQESSDCTEGVAEHAQEHGGATGLIIVLEGGVVQSVVTTEPKLIGCTVKVVDYDEDEGDTSTIVQSDGKEIEAGAWDIVIEKAEIEVKE